MNIRSLSNPAQVLAKDKIDSAKSIKSDETADREANGQQAYSDEEAHRPLTEEEFEQAIEKLKANESIQNSVLKIVAETTGDQKIVKILSPDGKVVKRFVERDLYFFLFSSPQEKVHLVNKTA